MSTSDVLSPPPAKSSPPGQTRSGELREEICQRIEEDIATGALWPGARLDEAELAARFSISRTPVREAFIQLAAVGILDLRPRRGAVVPELSPHRIIEMFDVMAELEAMCGRLAARRMSDADQRALLAAHEACKDAQASGNADAYYFKNEIFHSVVYRSSHNTFLGERASALHRRLRPYRRLQLRVRDRVGASFSEHEAVVASLLGGDAERASEQLRNHVLVQGERFTDLMAMLHRVM
jgi:DNA-binding GntR family transcriptional regulator